MKREVGKIASHMVRGAIIKKQFHESGNGRQVGGGGS